MRTITLEEHISTPAFLQALDARSQLDLTNEFMRRVREKLVDLGAGRLADMDSARIDMQVLSLAGGDMDRLDSPTASALARDANDALAAAVQAHPTRFAAFASVNLQDPGICRERARAVHPSAALRRRDGQRHNLRPVS